MEKKKIIDQINNINDFEKFVTNFYTLIGYTSFCSFICTIDGRDGLAKDWLP